MLEAPQIAQNQLLPTIQKIEERKINRILIQQLNQIPEDPTLNDPRIINFIRPLALIQKIV